MRRLLASVAVALVFLGFGANARAAAKTVPPPPAVTAIDALEKVHNVDLGGGRFGVHLTAPATLVNETGHTIACVIWFHDAAGNPIRSALAGWGDAANHLRVVSRDVVPASAREAVRFLFEVPYACFPRAPEGRHLVEARAVLLRRTAAGRVVLARRSTTFFVE